MNKRLLRIDGSFELSEYQTADSDNAIGQADNVFLPLQTFLTHRNELTERSNIGIWLDANEEIESLGKIPDSVSVIALNFPAFNDGRSFSSAVMLRRHLRYEGDIRAIGDVRIDQLEQMCRCGFTSFELAPGQNETLAVEKLKVFTNTYQSAVNQSGLLHNRAHS